MEWFKHSDSDDDGDAGGAGDFCELSFNANSASDDDGDAADNGEPTTIVDSCDAAIVDSCDADITSFNTNSGCFFAPVAASQPV